ncbi:MAG: methylenetetrahydrofolate--tRNA-(uracil(54)-C(5))-methyltransferase (FADH(2)-oxidizing) TrmFO [Erysipelotrichaceae bacterium]|nr:methylenetetrahydrofolate--tRNA-(uracil(54)-C(5))-methyltransferase (FADH(2)-oxidizing) TrmFO [Erysipelotrichaceae bacterium]
MKVEVNVIGAGLAGCEAAWQIAQRGVQVHLFEMKPLKKSEAHHSDDYAELVCSNSLRSNGLSNAVGVLKEELRILDSLILQVADLTSVPAGGALAVDRESFSKNITDRIKSHPLIKIHNEIVDKPKEGITVFATGPLTDSSLAEYFKSIFNEDSLYFYDAAAPIIVKDSIDFSIAYYKSRYDKGDGKDYINCPMTVEEFDTFYEALIGAEVVVPKAFEKEIYFEGCMPFEVMAKRGKQTLQFGPMKPVGLEISKEHKRSAAVVQLRRDNAADSLYNIVGFQTHLTWLEQRRIIRLIPGLQNAEIARYGVMHRNTYIKAPKLLNPTYQSKLNKNWFFAGQMTGVEGYVESTASGYLAGVNAAKMALGEDLVECPAETVLGSMAYYITHADPDSFQPMNANFGLIHSDLSTRLKDRKEKMALEALEQIKLFKNKL